MSVAGGGESMKRLIMVVNRLHDAFAGTGVPFGLELPEIAVVGGQSVGKSSVLESFVGRDFLPRGNDIVTRRPLVLQLITHTDEFAEFQHLPGKIFTNFDHVREEIQRETDRETGTRKGISKKSISLRIYSPYVLNLTLIDLPGMTRVAIGDQPGDIERQIREIVMGYVKKENTLLLAVSAANNDIANSDAMQIAKAVDPRGERTIGVLTKLDIMDLGTNARDIFLGEKLPLKRGYIGVMNRSQQDIIDGRHIEHALEAERDFFTSHPAYRDIADKMGTPYLQQKLNQILSKHIQETLPGIRMNLSSKIIELRKELDEIEDTSSQEGMRTLLMKLIIAFSDRFKTQIQGLERTVPSKAPSGGTRINRMFYNEFPRELDLEDIPVSELRERISNTIQNLHGLRNGIFPPDMAFQAIVHDIIIGFHGPVRKCASLVAQILAETIAVAAAEINHERLKEEVTIHVKEYLNKRLAYTQEQLIIHVDAEACFTNYCHEDFIEGPPQLNQGSSPFTQTLDCLKHKLDKVGKFLQKGHLLLGARRGQHYHYEKYWFTLTPEVLTWYTSKKESEDVFSLRMSSRVKQKLEEKTGDKFRFTLYRADGRPLLGDFKQLEMACVTDIELSSWTAAFKLCGVYSEETSVEEYGMCSDSDLRIGNEPFVSIRKKQEKQTIDQPARSPEHEKQIDTVQIMVQSYLQIVGKSIRDIVPKYIVLLLVHSLEDFVKKDLIPQLINNDKDVVRLMKLQEGEQQRQDELHKLHAAAENALSILNEATTIEI